MISYFSSAADNTQVLKGFKHSIQTDFFSCGLHSAYTILKYHKKVKSIKPVKSYLGDISNGTPIYKLIKLFRHKRLKVSVRPKASLKDIRYAIDKKKAPMLIYMDTREHWAVVYGYSSLHIYVMDPAPIYIVPGSIKFKIHFKKWKKSEFLKEWEKWGAIVYKLNKE